jgi:adenine-specific DNA-methyltransferase
MTDKDYDKLKQIEEAIQAFNSKKLYESSLALYKALDYQSNKTERISPATFDGFIDSFNLSKNAINKDKAFVSHWKHIEFIFQVADSEITRVQSLFDTGEVDRNEYQSFLFFTIQLKDESYKRSELVKITRELNVPFKMPVIVLFQYGNKLTLSIIDRRLHKKDSSKDVLEKVTLIKDIDITNPQRAHKEILKDLSLNELYKKFEFHSFVKLHEAWKATLNISELNKKFYKELAYWYFWALQEVEFPDDELKDDKTRNPVNVIRLITRLIFVWFLKEKNLIPDDLFNKRELDKILDYKDKTGSTYYKAILQNLFFATLNTEMNKDVKDKNKISRTFVNRNTGVPHYFRYSRFIKDQDKFAKWMDNIPFLNGGLFECLDKRTKDKSIYIDGFSQQVKNESLVTVPDYLFFSDAPRNIDLNNTFHTKGKKYEVRGLIDILSRYKFTIEENTPVEEEVALDPELLGKVFENLLASYNEETETTARKLTGSFYTPREIVNYMVDESLITYLCNSLLKEDDELKREELNTRLHHLFSYTAEEPQFTEAEKKDLIDAIDTCKILDPACGSGAFPMGILHKLVFILGKLDPNNKRWKQKQHDKAKRDKVLAEKMEDDKNRDAAIKEIDKRIDDIEKAFNQNNHELDFARKLYLIENCIYGVDKQPVAIQISKLRFFIALIVDQKTENDSEPNRGIRPLPNLETKFVAADTLVSIEKPEQLTLMNEDEALQKEIRDKEADIHRVREKHFRARTPDTKEKYRLLDAQHRDELAKLLEKDGFPKAATKQLAGWNPYDQNKFADFFDPMWMFEIDNGFDIVIGNPPYGIKFSSAEKEYLRKKFTELEFKIDSYEVFILKSIKLLSPYGICTYIIPSNLMDNFFTKKIRHKLLTQTQIKEATELDDKVFEAVVHSMILSFTNNSKKEYDINCRIDKSIQSPATKIPNTFFLNEEHNTFFFRKYLYLELINRIYNDCDKLEKWLRLKDGIDTGDNKKYISEKKIDKNWKKVIGGQDVDRWSIKNYNWIHYGSHLANPRDISIFEQEKILIRETGNRIISTFDDDKFYALSTLYIGNIISEKLSLKSILCLLNSNLYHFLMYLIAFSRTEGAFTKTRIFHYYGLPVPKTLVKSNELLCQLCEYILFVNNTENGIEEVQLLSYEIEKSINGCVYELYFGDEMKKAGVAILALVEKDLEAVKKLSPEKAIAKLYEKWQEPKNEVRNRLLLMSTRCPDTIGVIEASVS